MSEKHIEASDADITPPAEVTTADAEPATAEPLTPLTPLTPLRPLGDAASSGGGMCGTNGCSL